MTAGCFLWSGKRDSNPRHSAWKADALPTELFPHCSSIIKEKRPPVNSNFPAISGKTVLLHRKRLSRSSLNTNRREKSCGRKIPQLRSEEHTSELQSRPH